PQGDGFRYTTDIVPGVANAVPVLLVNNGSAPDTLSLTVENASGFFPFPLVQDAFVLPGQNASAAVSLSPQTVPPGEYGLRLQVTSKLTGAVRNTTLTVRVGSSSGFVLQGPADTGNRTLLRGASDRVVLQIANTGNEPQRLSMLVQQAPDRGDPWNAAVTPPTVELAAGARTTVILDVSAPPEAEDGTANTLTVVASGRTASRNITLSYVLNPRYELSLEPDVTHKVVTPGNGSSFEITVRNTGSIPTTVQIAFEAKERGVSKGWGVLIDRTPFDLRPAQEKRLTLGVFSPRDAGDDDTLELIVNSTIPGHLEVWSNATVFATVRTAARPPVERAPFEVPDAGLALTILSLGLAGRGLQRRKPE
ncbi:MAG: COG1470 family protein, partial [Methanobacteriota archaeon]